MVSKKYTKQQLTTENQIRNILLSILRDKDIRLSNEYIYSAESPVIDSLYREIGYIDIFVTNVKHFLERSEEHYIIECKRLDGGLSLNRKYLTEGVMRFINNKYVTRHKSYGMIGFLVDKNFDAGENIGKINQLAANERIPVEFIKEIQPYTRNSYGVIYYSKHKKRKDLYHLMFRIADCQKSQE
jgi:hypothetical protein